MRRSGVIGVFIVMTVLLAGCATLNPGNAINTSNIQSIDFSQVAGMKRGEACTTIILGIFSDGSSMITDAARSGGIKTVELVEYKNSANPLFAKHCTIVFGR